MNRRMSRQKTPWSFNFQSPSLFDQQFGPAPLGCVTRLQGMYISAPPFSSVSGPGNVILTGAFIPVATTSSSMTFFFQPSTSAGVNVPVDFGETGIVFPEGWSVTGSSGGTPEGSYGVSIVLWGVFSED